MKAYWTNLNEREKWVVTVGGMCFAIYLLYALIYAPLHEGVLEKTTQYQNKQILLQWMKNARKQYQTSHQVQKLSESQLLTVLTEQLKQSTFKTFPYQLQQTGKGDIQLVFEAVPYRAYLEWIWRLNQRYGIRIRQLSIERTKTAGVVKASVMMVTR